MNKNALTDFQRNEITEHIVYNILAKQDKSSNSEILAKISREEMAHYEKIRSLTKTEIKPNWFKVFWYVTLAKILGLTFALKLMERGEEKAQRAYSLTEENIFTELIADEKTHEGELLRLIDEEKLDYIGSMVLGLNDALVELTGALAGLTLAIQKTSIVALSGIITGIAAALSMAASDYLSRKSEGGDKRPLKSALYTGIAYIFTVLFLTFPYLILKNPFIALSLTVINAIIVIFIFTFFVSVVKDQRFGRNFVEMLAISLGVASVSFFIGLFVRKFFNIDI
ncbi:MAG TPA: VIT1/CCC1 transporter family protein [Pseudothermotoga sp.]|nr:VIT1/CCC1 transporter family protein [Pseudothermotoga sp.]HOK84025.1 VIT1/CCC1 transporter family protein [Pseudothermotoga sp.]HPP70491.1 VIT1/CCC1 transporter family protein [Pseudothermotoga sp.]